MQDFFSSVSLLVSGNTIISFDYLCEIFRHMKNFLNKLLHMKNFFLNIKFDELATLLYS